MKKIHNTDFFFWGDAVRITCQNTKGNQWVTGKLNLHSHWLLLIYTSPCVCLDRIIIWLQKGNEPFCNGTSLLLELQINIYIYCTYMYQRFCKNSLINVHKNKVSLTNINLGNIHTGLKYLTQASWFCFRWQWLHVKLEKNTFLKNTNKV